MVEGSKHCYRIDLIMRSVRLSARWFCKLMTAHTAAGIHPNMVHCRIRQMIPRRILPLRKNDNHGNTIAISVMIMVLP